jgi:hypothetical protein
MEKMKESPLEINILMNLGEIFQFLVKTLVEVLLKMQLYKEDQQKILRIYFFQE